MTRTTTLTLCAAPLALMGLAAQAEDRAAKVAEAFAGHAEERTITLDHAAFAEVLEARVSETDTGTNAFDYAGVTPEERALLDGYVAAMEKVDPGLLTRDQKIAYWANLYNAVTLQVVLDAMPVDSIRDIALEGPDSEDKGFLASLKDAFQGAGPWDALVAEVNGIPVSLNDMEHRILRRLEEPEPRIHYAVNCASYSCPDLRVAPWSAETLDADLDEAAAEYVNHPRGLMQDEEGNLTVSSIYDWFQADFGGDEAGVIAHMRPHADAGTAVALERQQIDAFDYDWTLNSPEKVAEIEAEAGS